MTSKNIYEVLLMIQDTIVDQGEEEDEGNLEW